MGSPRIPDRPGSWRFVLDGFMTPWSLDAFGSGSSQANGLALVGQPWSYLRLEAYGVFRVVRGARTHNEQLSDTEEMLSPLTRSGTQQRCFQ